MKPSSRFLTILLLPFMAMSLSAAPAEEKAADKKPAAEKKASPKKKKSPPVQKPTFGNISYGPHAKQFFHFWQAESDEPTPLLLFIHGGGWRGGNLMAGGIDQVLPAMLENGISVASIEYRFVTEADGIEPPVKAPLHDAARALQTIRSRAEEWNIDKTRIGASGGSAGACSSLWLAFHDDMADPDSSDPIARESTRLTCAAVRGAQTTLDPQQMIEWTPNSRYGNHAFGIEPEAGQKPFEAFLAAREDILPWIAEYSPYALVSADDPPVYLLYNGAPAIGEEQKDPTHTANFGLKLQEHVQSVGGEAELVYPGAPDVKHENVNAFLISKLKGE